MALSEVQTALARLFTDEAARAAYFKDPQGAGRSLGLDDADARLLAELAPRALRQFAGSLKAKRVLDARKRTPLTAQVLGVAFNEHLHAAAATLPIGAGRVEEAHALADRLAAFARTDALSPDWIGDLARYEAAFVEAAYRRAGLRLLLFRYPVGIVAAALQAGSPIGDIPPRATLGLWARWPGGRLTHRLWRLTR